MKTRFRLLLLCTMLLAGLGLPAMAQERVSTGVVERIDANTGYLSLRSDQTKRPIDFFGMDQAMLVQAGGQPATLADLKPGMMITVQYAARDKKWYVSKIIFGDASATAPVGTATAVPGSNAAPNVTPNTNAAVTTTPAGTGTVNVTGTVPANTNAVNPAAAAQGIPPGMPVARPTGTDSAVPVRNRSGGNAPSVNGAGR